VRELTAIFFQILQIFPIALMIACDLAPQILARVTHEMAVVKGFNGSLQRECDKQADRDRQQMKEEVAPSPRRVMKRMNVHELSLRCSLAD
jgi:hypothetical protein